MNWLDKFTLSFAPKWTARRIAWRTRGALLARNYEAASTGYRTQGWVRSGTDPNAAVGSAGTRLRDAARDLVRNNAYAEAALSTIIDHCVGVGIVAKPYGRSQASVLERWKAWAETTACDADGRLDLAGIQKLVMRTVVESGECLVRRRIRLPEDGLPIPLQLQVLEPDYLDSLKDESFSNSDGVMVRRVIQGVEFNAIGQRTGYWLLPEHPGATTTFGSLGGTTLRASRRVPAEDILHVFRPGRPGQVRGVPWLAPVMLRLKELDEFQDATLMKQKIAACLAVLTTDVDGTSGNVGGADATNNALDLLSPGMIANVAPGRQITVVDPPAVNEHQAYVNSELRAIAVGLGVTMEDLTGDYCIAPETRVLRADLRWVRADELQVGDEIVAFDENRPGKGQFRKHRRASVVRAGRRNLPRVSVKTDRVAVSVSTDHMFLCTRPQKGNGTQWKMHQWVRAEDLEPGDQILFLVDPWEEGTTHTHGYLKGIADGEGCVDTKRGSVNISQKPGPVFDEIGQALADLGFRATPRGDGRDGKPGGAHIWDMNRMAECLRFLGEVRPTRLLTKAARVYEGKAVTGGRGKRTIYSRVLSAEPEGVGPVVTLETTTHTVITEGLYSHNTNMPFSAARMSRLRHWARVEDWRWRMLIPQFCDPVWRWAMEVGQVMGVGDIELGAQWTCPPLPMVDPEAEGRAIQNLVRNGAVTWPEMIRERGYDPDAVLAEIKEWNQKLDRDRIILDCDARMTSQQGQARELPLQELAERIDALGALIRAGYEPDDSLKVVGLPKIDHTGKLPVTVQPERSGQQQGGFQQPASAPNGNGNGAKGDA